MSEAQSYLAEYVSYLHDKRGVSDFYCREDLILRDEEHEGDWRLRNFNYRGDCVVTTTPKIMCFPNDILRRPYGEEQG
jgi:hypothetical protein